ncbi:MAG TPA: acyltransferase, partial [Isosphaeraceae bacterium]
APLLAFPAQLTWSLAVEEQFYILWPLLVGLVGVVFMAPMALAFIGVAIAARFLGLSESLLVTRCDGFAMGGLLAMALAGRRESDSARALNRRLTFVASVCALYLLVVPPLQGYPPCVTHGTPTAPVDIAVASALFAAVIGLVVINQGKRALAPLRARLIVYLGTISYGIYLYHIAAQVCGDAIVSRLGLPRGVSRAAVSPALVLGVSAASWAWLEKPCLRLKDRFGYGRTRIDTALEGPPGPEAAPGAPNQIGPEIETVA